MSGQTPTAPEIFGVAFSNTSGADLAGLDKSYTLDLGNNGSVNSVIVAVYPEANPPWRMVEAGTVTFYMRADPVKPNGLYIVRYTAAATAFHGKLPRRSDRPINNTLERWFQQYRHDELMGKDVYTALLGIPGRTPEERAEDVHAKLIEEPGTGRSQWAYEIVSALWPLPEEEIVALIMKGVLPGDALVTWRKARKAQKV